MYIVSDDNCSDRARFFFYVLMLYLFYFNYIFCNARIEVIFFNIKLRIPDSEDWFDIFLYCKMREMWIFPLLKALLRKLAWKILVDSWVLWADEIDGERPNRKETVGRCPDPFTREAVSSKGYYSISTV